MDIVTFVPNLIETMVNGLEGIRSGILRMNDQVNGRIAELEKKVKTLSDNTDYLSQLVNNTDKKVDYAVNFVQQQPQHQQQQQSTTFKKGIMEHKIVQSLKPLTGDKGQFRQWHLKAMSALSQVNPEYGQIRKAMETDMDTGKKQDEVAWSFFLLRSLFVGLVLPSHGQSRGRRI